MMNLGITRKELESMLPDEEQARLRAKRDEPRTQALEADLATEITRLKQAGATLLRALGLQSDASLEDGIAMCNRLRALVTVGREMANEIFTEQGKGSILYTIAEKWRTLDTEAPCSPKPGNTAMAS